MLSALFKPKRVAVVGASHNPNKIGAQILKNIKTGKFKGKIYPINPKGGKIQGLKVYPSLSQAPEVADLAIIAVKPQVALEAIKEAVKLKVKSLVVISAGFKETSSAGAKLEEEIQTIIKNSQTRLLGVNCLGLLSYADPKSPLNATFLNKLPQNGQVAFASQSGAFGSAVVDWADKIDLGLKYFVSLGNKTDLTEIDFLTAWNKDNDVKVIALYLENIVNGEKFKAILKELAIKKPVILLMPGSSEEAKKAITSHTGSIVNDDVVLDLVFEKYNVIRAQNMRQFFKLILMMNVLAKKPVKRPGGNSLILTNAGGPGVLATDLIHKAGLKLIDLDPKIKKRLREFLPEAASVHNPVDVLGDAQADRYQKALEVLSAVYNLDQIFIILTPQTITEVKETAEAIYTQSQKTDKLLVPIFIGGTDVKAGLDYLREHGMPAYSYIIDAVEAVSKIDQWYKKLNFSQLPTKHHLPQKKKQFFSDVDQVLGQINYKGRLDPRLERQLLKILGLKLPPNKFIKATDLEKIVKDNNVRLLVSNFRSLIKFPWVVKLASTQVLHNTDVKGVYTNIRDSHQATKALIKLNNLIHKAGLDQEPGTYVVIQSKVENVVEMLVGLKKDKDFGGVMVFGSGGIYANLYEDVEKILLPTDKKEIKTKLKKTKFFKLVSGYRGKEKFDLEKIIETIYRVSLLNELLPGLKEADFNPIIINRHGQFVVDAKLIF